VLGYNDAPFVEHVHPPLSTIGFPGDRIGETAAEVTLSLIADPGQLVGSLAFPPTLVERASTAAPPDAAPTRTGRTAPSHAADACIAD